jgi:hypothetical protein
MASTQTVGLVVEDVGRTDPAMTDMFGADDGVQRAWLSTPPMNHPARAILRLTASRYSAKFANSGKQ